MYVRTSMQFITVYVPVTGEHMHGANSSCAGLRSLVRLLLRSFRFAQEPYVKHA